MSIIYDALQKTQHNRANKRDKYFQETGRRIDLLDIALLVIIAALVVVIVTGYYPKLVTKKYISRPLVHPMVRVVPPAVKRVVPIVQQPVIHVSVPIKTEMAYQGKLVLNGVFLSGQEKLALINNQSFRLGDTVDGMKIINIDMNSIKLNNANGTFVMRMIVG